MQQPPYPLPQSVQRNRHAGQVLHGVVLRIQAASDYQRERGDSQLHIHPGRRGRQSSAEDGELRECDIRQTGRRQGIHLKGTVRRAVYQRHTAHHENQE